MKHTWRWFGPQDITRLEDVAQAGARGIVSALHHVPTGAVWTPEEIRTRQEMISSAKSAAGVSLGLNWDVVESLPVSEDIKQQRGDWRAHVENYRTSLRNLAAAGIETICYNFMPVLDWTRTDLRWRVPNGGTCMRFDFIDFAAFDIHILERAGAAESFPAEIVEQAAARFAEMTDERRAELTTNVTCGLPGAAEHLDLAGVREHLSRYDGISPDQLRKHLIDFLSEVVPVAEELGLRLCCHPDDPPFPLMGLPRIMSTADDYAKVLDAVDSPANGMTLCSGSLGSRPDNDLVAMMERFGPKVHFLHLRNVRREGDAIAGSFFEDEHLEGNTDMVALISAVLREEKRRRDTGRKDHQIPMRPDHGQDIIDDLNRTGQPGYPIIGRLKGLAELRGVERALTAVQG